MISLIVATYNVKEYVKEFLDSVVNQTFKDFEAILVNDGSTDGTDAILNEYADKYDFIKAVHKENGGCVSAWKRGLKEAKGEFITFADPDDIMVSNALEMQYRLMTENNADLVITGINRLEKGKLIQMPADNWSLEEGVYTGERLKEIKQSLFGNRTNKIAAFFFARWNKLFKRQIIFDNLNFSNDNITFGEDVCISASAILDSNVVVYSKTPLYIYRIRDDSLTTVNFNVKQIDDAANLMRSVRAMLSEKGYMNEFVYYNDPSYHIMRLMRKIGNLQNTKTEKKKYLKTLKTHTFVSDYDLKKAKKYISFRRYVAIWLLKHSMYGLLLKLL